MNPTPTIGEIALQAIRERTRGLDYRGMGLFRIGFGLILFANLWFRLAGGRLEAHYTNDGVLPVGLLDNVVRWSFLDAFPTPTLARLAFFGILAVYLCYTAGIFTRLSQWLVVLCLVSLYHRNPLLDDGSDWVMRYFAIWTAFLPLGERFSFDALVRAPGPEKRPDFRSLAVWGFLLNTALSYYLNAWQKSGVQWMDGSAVRWVLWDAWVAGPFAALIRGSLPDWAYAALTHSAKGIEYTLTATILASPFTPWAGRIAAAGVVTLHGGFALTMNIGTFPFMYLPVALLFVPGEDWDRWFPKRPPRAFPAEAPSPVPTRRWLFEAAAGMYLVVCLTQMSLKNPAFPAGLKAFLESHRASWIDDFCQLILVPQEWYMFSRFGERNFVLTLEVEMADGSIVDGLRGGRFDLMRSVNESFTYPKHWKSYLWRLGLAPNVRHRDQFLSYLYARGARRVTFHRIDYDVPKHPGEMPKLVSHQVLFTKERATRIKLAPEHAVAQTPGLAQLVQPMVAFGTEWTPPGQWFVRFAGKDWVEAAFPFETECAADVELYFTKAPDYGTFRVSLNGQPALPELDLYAPSVLMHKVAARLPLRKGTNRLRVDSVGKNRSSAAHFFGLDRIEAKCAGNDERGVAGGQKTLPPVK